MIRWYPAKMAIFRSGPSSLNVRVLAAASVLSPLSLATLSLLGGCQAAPKPDPIVAVQPMSFVRGWSAKVGNTEPLTQLSLVGDQLYAYSRDNQAYVFSAPSGSVLYSDQIAPAGSPLRPPVALLDNKVVYPISDGLVMYDKPGRRLTTIHLGKTITSPGVANGNTVYIGISGTTGGRLASLDFSPQAPTPDQVEQAKKLKLPLPPQLLQNVTKWEVFTGAAVQGAPAVFQGVVYAGTSDGKVWAINESGSGIWDLPDGSNTFQAAGAIRADLKVDDVGVYVASMDGKLYCVDRGSGRIKWAYYAASPLEQAPVLGATTLYQPVADVGLVAIDKHSNGIAKAKWINSNATQFLSEDDKYVYARKQGGGLLALDKNTGVEQFESVKRDLTLFAVDPKMSIIYGAKADGLMYSIKPVLIPGIMGILADSTPAPFEQLARATYSDR